MAASISFPDLAEMFPHLEHPSEGAFIAIGQATMPAGMIGLLISGIFAATMSSMDAGLNKNAGFFVKNFFVPILRSTASEKEQLFVSKLVTLLMGLLVILAALTFSSWKDLQLFDLMLQFGGFIALPVSVPLIWATIIRRAPAWAGWSTVLVGFVSSLVAKYVLTPDWFVRVMGWSTGPTPREASDWGTLSGVLLNTVVCTAWFLASCWFHRTRSEAEKTRVANFFKQMATPVDFEREVGSGNDAQQCRVLGLMCLVYGAFMLLMVLVPNSPGGRFGMFCCAASIFGVGAILHWNAKRLKAKNLKPTNNHYGKPER
jgi:Na+/proline symporter